MKTIEFQTGRRLVQKPILILATVLFLAANAGGLARAAEGGAPEPLSAKAQDGALQALARDNAMLRERLRQLERTPSLTGQALTCKSVARFQEIARDARAQRQAMTDFEAFVTWMTANLSGYAKYVQAGSVAAGLAKVLPIPYAGQASVLTKFVSQGLLSLNGASVAIAKYLGTSQQFVARVEALEAARPNPREIADLARFADGELLRDMTDVQQRLAGAAELSTSALSFLETLNHYVGSTDEYWGKTKAFLTRSESAKKEKSFLAESIAGLKNRTEAFNGKLRLFNDTGRKDLPLIKSLIAYDELSRELEAPVTQANLEKRP